jgi:hypothetical protein
VTAYPTSSQYEGSVVTIGKWPTESESAAALDRHLASCRHLFNVYPECRGELLQPRYGQKSKTVRIDRILLPRPPLIEAGWTHGALGLEVKRSGEKVGPALAQMTDYGRSAWIITVGRVKVWLDWIFLWPLDEQFGTVASMMAQNRLGSAWSSGWYCLNLYSGQAKVLRVDHRGRPDIGAAANGLQTGSR